MARGDKKSSGRGGYSGGGSSYSYNDAGRGNSKNHYEVFLRGWERAGYARIWLEGGEDGLGDTTLYNVCYHTTYRYTVHDWATHRFDDPEGNDGRVRRLVIQKCDLAAWRKLQARAKDVYDKAMKELEARRAEREQQGEIYRASFQAEQLKRKEELRLQARNNANLVAGSFRSDFHDAFTYRDSYGHREGDWLEDPVDAVANRAGFGVEEERATGLKVQITVSIDRSNSMAHNRAANGERFSKVAGSMYRDLWLALEQMKREFPDSLFIGAFEFAFDTDERVIKTDWYRGEYVEYVPRPGRGAECLSHHITYSGEWRDMEWSDEETLGAVQSYMESYEYKFSGEDTWFYPLFELIEKWEQRWSDPGAVKLDLILSDAVIEHPTDITRSDVIQERRDGALQTVILNLLPEHEWVNSDLPAYCVQYPANPDNLSGLLRTLISNFVGAYI